MRKTLLSDRPQTETVPYDLSGQLRTSQEMAAYLDAWLVDGPDDVPGIMRALGDIARAQGMSVLARETGLGRESLYNALSETGNPSFANMLKVTRALGLQLRVEAA